jgi:hypothetical protein
VPSLNDVCPDRGVARRLSDSIVASDDALASRRFRKRSGYPTERWVIRFSVLVESEIETLREFEDSVGRTFAFAWSPPNDACQPGRAWRIEEYRDGTADSPGVYWAELTVLHMPGVDPD